MFWVRTLRHSGLSILSGGISVPKGISRGPNHGNLLPIIVLTNGGTVDIRIRMRILRTVDIIRVIMSII